MSKIRNCSGSAFAKIPSKRENQREGNQKETSPRGLLIKRKKTYNYANFFNYPKITIGTTKIGSIYCPKKELN